MFVMSNYRLIAQKIPKPSFGISGKTHPSLVPTLTPNSLSLITNPRHRTALRLYNQTA